MDCELSCTSTNFIVYISHAQLPTVLTITAGPWENKKAQPGKDPTAPSNGFRSKRYQGQTSCTEVRPRLDYIVPTLAPRSGRTGTTPVPSASPSGRDGQHAHHALAWCQGVQVYSLGGTRGPCSSNQPTPRPSHRLCTISPGSALMSGSGKFNCIVRF